MENPAIYVADLAAYNNGILHGVWIDATQDIEDIWQAVREMLKATPLEEVADEWAIHDYMNVSVRCDRSDGGGQLPIMSMINNGHLEALHGGKEGPEEAVLV